MSKMTETRVTCQSESMITLYKLASPYVAEIDQYDNFAMENKGKGQNNEAHNA